MLEMFICYYNWLQNNKCSFVIIIGFDWWSSRTSSTSGLVTSFLHSPLNKSWMGQLSSSCTSGGCSHLFHRSPPAPVSVPMEEVSSCL
eukprot:bmy_21956T0